MQEILLYAQIYSTPVLTSVALFISGIIIYRKSKSLSALCLSIFTVAFLGLTLFANFSPTEMTSSPGGDTSALSELAELAFEFSGVFLIAAAASLLVYACKLKRA